MNSCTMYVCEKEAVCVCLKKDKRRWYSFPPESIGKKKRETKDKTTRKKGKSTALEKVELMFLHPFLKAMMILTMMYCTCSCLLEKA